MTSETYLAAEAFPGEYEITVERVWGRPLGNKAQLRVIRHQGTEDETEQLVTLSLLSNRSEPVRVKLEDGRRTEAAAVPPPEALEPPDTAPEALPGPDQVLNRLRALADPEVTGFEQGGLRGGTGSGARSSGVLPRRMLHLWPLARRAGPPSRS